MTTSNEHERIKKWIGDLLADYFSRLELRSCRVVKRPLRLALKEAGAEPDESWCLAPRKGVPDLVLEIALTSGGVSKPEVYRRFPGAGGLVLAAERA